MEASVINPSQPTNHSESPVIPVSALPIGETLKEYVITGIIGEGGFGIVYSARDTLLQRNVAIKEYMPAAIANRLASSHIHLRSLRHQQTFDAGMQGFIDEARLLAQFKHSALVEILRFWEANGTAYMVMPHYSGKTLRNLLRQNRNACSESWLKSILAPILDATELLHNNNIYHRDIAPDNIVVQDNGQPVLLDLGSARRVIAGMQSALTVVVKPGYAPIEQYTEDTINEQGPWTDIYALGAVIYFSLTGAAPSASVSRMMRDTLKTLTTKNYPHFSESFLEAVNRALQLRPADRFQSVEEFREALNINTVFVSHTPIPPQNSKATSEITTSHADDEITQILTEEEINQFKEKLLHTLSGAKSEIKPQQPQEFPENLLSSNIQPENKSISSFDDLKDLLEQKPIPTLKTTPAVSGNANNNPKMVKETPAVARNRKSWPVAVPAVIAATLLFITLLVVMFLANSSSELDNGISSENVAAIEAQPPVAISASNPGITEENTVVDPTQNEFDALLWTENTYPPQSSLTPTPTIASELPPEGSPETSITPEAAPELVEVQEVDLAAIDETETYIEATSTPVKPQQKVQPETIQTVEFGSAKLTILPWGEIWVDNQRYGVSPPVRELSLTPGTYRIELRNPGLPTETRTITFLKGENAAIYHNFSAPQQKAENTEKQTANTQTDSGNNKQSQTPQNTTAPKEDNAQTAAKTEIIETSTTSQTQPAITSERTLSIKVLPWGEVFLNGKMMGVTPPLHQLKLSPGEHTIEIRHPSYTSKIIQISAADPTTATLEHHFK